MPFTPPTLDYHGLAPEIILTLVIAAVLIADLFLDQSRKWLLSNIAAFGLVAAIGTVFAAGYLLWMLQRVAMGVVKPEFEKAHIHDVHIPEYIAWTPLLVGILLFGIFPHLLFDMIDPAVNVVTAGVDALGNAAAGAGR